jgi:hypothetical protein
LKKRVSAGALAKAGLIKFQNHPQGRAFVGCAKYSDGRANCYAMPIAPRLRDQDNGNFAILNSGNFP